MKKIEYNKLIRDKIPEIIEHSGKNFSLRKIEGKEYEIALKNKLLEESAEIKNAANRNEMIEELADLFEVIGEIQNTYSIRLQDIKLAQTKKAIKNGKFESHLFLEYVMEDENDDE